MRTVEQMFFSLFANFRKKVELSEFVCRYTEEYAASAAAVVGLVRQVRFLILVPPPHSTVHADQGEKSPQPVLIEKIIRLSY